MGSEAYVYFVPYHEDAQAALDALRAREFKAGRYSPVIHSLPAFSEESPGAAHASIEEAREAAGESGTRSILDVERVSEEPGYGVATRLSDEELEELFGTAMPSRDMLEDMAFFEDRERGECVYFPVYENGKATEIVFAGWSYD